VSTDHTTPVLLLSFRVAFALYLAALGPVAVIAGSVAYAAAGNPLACFAVNIALGLAAGWWHERPVAWIQRWLGPKPTPGE
jgi:hypothetical protein